MRKKFLKAAIASFAATIMAAFGFMFVKPIATETPTAEAATTGLSSWTTSGSVSVSGDSATISAGGYIYLSASSSYSLTFSTTRATTGGTVLDVNQSLLIGINVASTTGYTAGTWFAGSTDQNSTLWVGGSNVTNTYMNNSWCGQDGEMTLTVSNGAATLTHAVHGVAYQNFPVGTSGSIVFYVPSGAGNATLSGVTYTDNSSSSGGSSGSTSSLSDWTTSGSVSVSGDTATISAGGHLYLSASSDYTLTFSTTRATTGGTVLDVNQSLLIGINVASTTGYTAGTWFAGSTDQNSTLWVGGSNQTNTYQNNSWCGQNGEMTLTVSNGAATLTHAVHGVAYQNFPVGTTGYIVFYVPTGAGSATVSGVTYTDNTASGTPSSYNVVLKSTTGGSVDGGGLGIAADSSVTVKATTETGYKFNGWSDGSSIVSTDAEYTFTLTKNVNLTAQFAQDRSSLPSGNDGTLPDWTTSGDVGISNGTAYIFGGGYISMPVTSEYTVSFVTTRSKEGAAILGSAARSLLIGMSVADPANYQTGAWVYGSVDQNSNLVINGSASSSYFGDATIQGWAAQDGSMTLTVSGGVANLRHNEHGPAYVNVPVSSSGYVSFYVPSGAYFATVSGISAGDEPTPPPGTGATQYTQFNEALDTSKWETTGGSVSGGVFNASWAAGGYLASVGTYGNFVLDFDVTGLTSAPLLLGFGASSITTSAPFVQVNSDGLIPSNFSGTRTWAGYDYSGTAAHFRLEVYNGTVKAGVCAVGGTMATAEVGTLVQTGRVFIMNASGGSFQIDNLVLINSSEYDDYVVEKKTLGAITRQETANTTVTGTVDLGDMTNKKAKFVPTTKGLVMDENTGAWSLTAPATNGGHAFYYNVIVYDLVLDGWIYPLGSAGEYLLSGTININVTGGEQGDVEGGEGDTTYVPEITGETEKSVVLGKAVDVVFEGVDLKGKDILKVQRGAGATATYLVNTAYTYNATAKTFTFNASYIGGLAAAISAGRQEFAISTAKGSILVVIVFEQVNAPTLSSGSATVSMKQYSTADLTFKVASDAALTGIAVARTGVSGTELKSDAYTYASGTLTIKGSYLSLLPVGATKFTVNNAGGSLTLTVNVTAVSAPTTTETTAKEVKAGSTADVTFAVDTKGEAITEIAVTRTNGLAGQALETTAYSYASGTLTIKGAYISTLEVGTAQFTVKTLGGSVTVNLTINAVPAPVVSGTTEKEVEKNDPVDVTFTVDTKGESITKIVVIRSGAADQDLASSVWSISGTTLTIKAAYVQEMPAGTTTFNVTTAGGTASVKITVVAMGAPYIEEGCEEFTVAQGDAEEIITYVLMGDGEPVSKITKIEVKHGSAAATGLDASVWTYADGELIISADYVKELAIGTTTFTIYTTGGSATVTLTITGRGAPVVSGSDTVTKKVGTAEDAIFTVNTNGETITKIEVRGVGLKEDVWTISGTTLTIKAAYVKELPVGTTTLTLITAGGRADVKITITAIPAPAVSGDTNKTFVQGASNNAIFSVDTDGETITKIEVRGVGLKEDVWTYDGFSLTISSAYVKELPVGVTTLTIITAGGEVDVTITITDIPDPVVSGTATATLKQGAEENVSFTIDAKGELFELVAVIRDGEEKATLDASAYTYAGSTLTILASYVKLMPVGTTTFEFTTTGGTAEVSIVINARAVPSVTDNSVDVKEGENVAVEFALNTDGAAIDKITLTRDSEVELSTGVWTYEDGTLTISADYVKELEVGTTTLTIQTLGGTVDVSIVVKARLAPTISGSAEKYEGTEEAVTFTVDLNEEALIKFGVKHGDDTAKSLASTAYTFENGTLTILATYVKELPVGETKIIVYTLGGEASATITITDIPDPILDGSDTVSKVIGTEEDVTFTIDVQGQEIAMIKVRGQGLSDEVWTHAGNTLTIKAAYVKELPAGDTVLEVITAGGRVEVKITITERSAPTVEIDNVTKQELTNEDVTFSVDVKGETITKVAIKRAGAEETGLSEDVWTHANGTLTISKDYVKELPVGVTTISVITTGGKVSMTITITKIPAPVVTPSAERPITQTFKVGQEAAAAYTIDTKAQNITQVVVKRDGAEDTYLSSDVWTYADGVFTISADYVKELLAGTTAFEVCTLGGSVTVYVKVLERVAPTVNGEAEKTLTAGSNKNVAFSVDTDGETITKIAVRDQGLSEDVWTYADGTLTIKAAYVKELPVGETTLTIITIGGEVEVKIIITAISAPVVDGEASQEFVQNTASNAVFTVDTDGEAIMKIAVNRDGADKTGLSEDAWTFVGTTLTFKADYVKELPVGTTTFTVVTAGGEVDVTIVITSKAPVLTGEASETKTAGTAQDVTFAIDTKGEAIAKIAINREGADETNLKDTAYTYEDGALTIKAAYVKELPEGTTTFTVVTAYGEVEVTIVITERAAPTVSDPNSVEKAAGTAEDVTFTVDVKGAEVTKVEVSRDSETKDLSPDAWTYADGTLTIKAVYVKELPVGTTTITVVTVGGEVSMTIVITGNAPTVSGEASVEKVVGTAEDVTFTVDTKNEEIVKLGVKRAGEEDTALASAVWTYEDGTLTIKAAYVKELPVGTTTFEVITNKGKVSVSIVITAREVPTVSGDTTKEVKQGAMEDVTFAVDTKGEEIAKIGVRGVGLSPMAWTYAEGTLTFKAEYVAVLPVGTTTFTIVTAGGSVEVEIVITERTAPSVTEDNADIDQCEEEDVTYAINLNGETLQAVMVNGEELEATAYAYADGTLTIKAAYVKTLPAGVTTFEIVTTGGSVEVTVTAAPKAPVVTVATASVVKGSETIVQFVVDAFGQEVSVATKAETPVELTADQFVYGNGRLIIDAEYVATLTATTTFTVTTAGGSVEVTITVTEPPQEEPDVENSGGSGNIWADDFDWDNWTGDVQPNVDDDETSGSGDGCGSSISAISSLVLIGAAAVALVIKKKQD